MALLCESCERTPFPKVRKYHEATSSMMRKYRDKGMIYEGQQSLRKIAMELAKYIGGMEKELQMAREALEATRILIVPIQRLPDEILTQIIDIFALSNYYKQRNGSKPLSPPRSLSQATLVCKRWRSIIYSTSSLWSTIYLPSRISHLQPLDLQFLEMQFKHAGHSLLTLTSKLVTHIRPPAYEPPDSDALFIQLRPYYAQFMKIELHIPPTAIYIFETQLPMPTLKYLKLNISGISGEPVDVTLLSHNFPSLTHVDLYLDCKITQLSLPWPQLSDLKVTSQRPLGSITWSSDYFDPFSIIHHLIRIERLRIGFEAPSNHWHPVPNWDNLTLPHLRSLALHIQQDGHSAAPGRFVQRLDAPILQDVILDAFTPGTDFIHLYDVLQHMQFPAVATLNIALFQDTGHPFAVVIDALRAFRGLETFSCFVHNDTGMTRSILLALSSRGHEEALFPHLKSLDLGYASIEALEVLQNFVRERLSGVQVAAEYRKPLRTVFIYCADDGETASMERSRHAFQDMNTVSPPNYNDGTTTLKIKGMFTEARMDMLNELSA